ncbi:MAG: ribbon-helix-helix protein, CopG family [Planctomycetota bacterium]|jgi:hypothetical protein
MARAKQVQILFEREEYERLEEVARARAVSLAELIRTAVREKYLDPGLTRDAALDGLLAMRLPLEGLEDWSRVKRMAQEAHDAGLP